MRLHLLRILLLTICAMPSLAYGNKGAQVITDFVVALDDTKNESTIYVTDEVSHAIYKIDGTHADFRAPHETVLTNLELFFQSEELVAPTGIAYFNGKLLVCDRLSDSVFEIDTTTRIVSLLFKRGVITAPLRVAVSQNGRVAVTNAAGDIVFYQRLTRTLSKRRIANTRIAFAGDDLLILNTAGEFLLIQGKSLEAATPTPLPLGELAVVGEIQQIVDAGFVNGIYYMAGDAQVYAHVRTKNATLPLFHQPLPSRSLGGIRVNRQMIALLDSRNKSILHFDRPIAMTAGFDEDSATAVAPFYEYLLNQNALPTRAYFAARDYKSATDLLREQKVVFPAVTDDQALLNLFCRLNKNSCRTPSEAARTIPIKKGEKITLPDLNYTELIGYNTRKLEEESVNDYLIKTFAYSPKIKDRFTADFLWSLNELSKSETLEFQLRTKVPGALMAMPPRRNLPPGNIVKLGKDQDFVAGTVAKCGIPVKSSTRTLGLAQLIRSTVKGPEAFWQLPRASTSATFTQRLQQLGITEVQYELENPTVELGDQKAVGTALSATIEGSSVTPTASASVSAITQPSPLPQSSATPQILSTPDQKSCVNSLFGPSNYFIVDAVKVAVGRYKIFRGKELIHFKEDLRTFGLLGEPDNDAYSIVVKTPFYVAYRLSPWANETVLQNPTITPITNLGSIKMRGNQDILKLKNVSLLLPYVKQWQFTFLLNEKELADEASEFNKLRSSHKFTTLRAEETSRVATAVSGVLDPVFDDSPPSLETVTSLRAGLKREINFTTDGNAIDVRIGIGEQPCTVDKNHPDFKNQDGTNAWMKDPAAAPVTCPSPLPEVVKKVKTQVDESEHGTHVAGLIGARANTTAPGLVPTAQLFLVDARDASTLFSAIDNAVARGVFIFNFSFGDLNNDETLQTAMEVTWAKRLFVVAVDNEGADLTKTKKPPVSWMDSIKNNMIGVGSSIGAKGSQYMLGDWEGARGLEPGSSYGKTYVQLIAPGHSIYSTIPGNAYGPATGTSFAAPQVTAAAAMLYGGSDITDPPQIKARLIYTSDWFEQLRGKVWGGFLNVGRAVWEPKRNLLITEAALDTIDSIKLDADKMTDLTIKGGIRYEPAGADTPLTKEILVPFESVLRITRRHHLFYRVIYLDKDRQMRIILNAAISGTIPCKGVEQWNGSVFSTSTCTKYGDHLDASQLLDYVARIPSDIKF